MSALRRVIVGDSLGAAVGTALILVLGVALVVSEADGLRAAVQGKPADVSCEALRANPTRVAWVALRDCDLSVDRAEWEGEWVRVPFSPAGEREVWWVTEDASWLAPAPERVMKGWLGTRAGRLELREGLPLQGRGLGVVFAGFLVVVWGLWPVARRAWLERERRVPPAAGPPS